MRSFGENKNGDYPLDRTKFHGALRAAFDYGIANSEAVDPTLRDKMRKRM